VELTALLNGKPTAAEVWRLGPKETAALEAENRRKITRARRAPRKRLPPKELSASR